MPPPLIGGVSNKKIRTELLAVDCRRDGANKEVLEEVLFRSFRHVARLEQLTDHVLQVLTTTINVTVQLLSYYLDSAIPSIHFACKNERQPT